MKARVKATGEIIEFTELMLLEEDRTTYRKTEDLEFLDLPINEPDYWEKLKHQYAGMAMQGLLSNSAYLENFVRYSVEGDSLARVVSTNAIDYATALVNRLEEEEK